jgi:hypothetical protein
MFSQPHTVLPWVVRRTRLPLLRLACAACPSQTHTTGRGRFRVNANGKLLHVWLLVRCRGCDRTVKLTVHERTPVSSLAPAELDGYHRNDAALVAALLLDPWFARRSRFGLDWTGAWRLDAPAAPAGTQWPYRVEVAFTDPVPVRPDRLIAHALGLSRNEVARRVKCGVPLRRTRTSGFAFTVLPAE